MPEFEPVLTARWDVDGADGIEGYLESGGYDGLKKALSMSPDDVTEEVKTSGLRGRGGAGFPTGVKWSFIPKDSGKPVYVVCNADEGEPGTFKDRELMERDPHQLIEGIAIASYAVGCRTAFIYMRGEFLEPGRKVERAIDEAYRSGFLGEGIAGSTYDLDIVVHHGAGSYECGEETALLESLEGKRGQPRLRPPFPAVEGLYRSPTVVNNVETLATVPHIINRGSEWFSKIGTERSTGTKIWCLSGKVARPGNYETPMGVPARMVIEDLGGGVRDGKALKAWTPGGSSTPFLTPDHLDTSLDFESVQEQGSLLGTGAVVVLDEDDCVVEAVLRWIQFYAHESCGKCTPCREGTWWLAKVLHRMENGGGREADIGLMDDVGDNMLFKSLCALGDGAVSPIASSIKFFRDEYVAHVEAGGCPLKERPRVAAVTARTGGAEGAIPLGGGVAVTDVTVTIDGRQVSVPEGTLIIRAAEALGVEIPRFCDHPLLDPVGACRTCLVEVEGQRKLTTSCTTTVADGMVIRTQNTSEAAAKGQSGQLEFLLINHPLDCPVCDRGGECPLQDQTLAFGPAESRYIDPKRVYRKPIELSPLVLLDRERCVLCARCTRFCDQISGERFIELFDRGAAEQVAIAPGEDFRSPFSGNTVQICPVGALTSAPYRFASRPFDNKSGDSVCPHCASGCNIRVDLRRGEVVRHLARDNMDVNEAWLCDKGRYAFRFPDRDRVTTPLLRVPGLAPASFQEVFGAIADRARGGRVAFLAGGRLTDEDAYALSKLARVAFRTNDIDHRQSPVSGGDVERTEAASAASVTYGDVEDAKVILVVGLDTREELPILHLRIRKGWRNNGARVFEVNPRRTSLSSISTFVPCFPGREAEVIGELESATDGPLGEIATALRDAGGSAIVLAGPRLGESPVSALSGLASMVWELGARFTSLPRRANDRGALRAGVHPSLLPGGRSVEHERADVEAVWGEVPTEAGRDTRAILEAASRKEIDVLFLVGTDPLTDVPDAALVRRALENVPFLVIQDITVHPEYGSYVDAVLPAAPFLEKAGHFTDWEGRGQRFEPVRNPAGLARPDWEIFQELSEVVGADIGLPSLEAIQEEMGRLLAPREVPVVLMGPRPQELSARVEDEITLFTYPLLVDDGRLSVDSDELKAALAEEPFVEIHPDDASRLNLSDGGRARVRTEAGEAELPVRVTDGIIQGSVFVPWNQAGFRANELLSGELRIQATLEPAGERVEAETG